MLFRLIPRFTIGDLACSRRAQCSSVTDARYTIYDDNSRRLLKITQCENGTCMFSKFLCRDIMTICLPRLTNIVSFLPKKHKFLLQIVYLSPSRTLCNRRCLSVCVSVSNFAENGQRDFLTWTECSYISGCRRVATANCSTNGNSCIACT